MSPCYCSSCDKSLRLPLARLYNEAVQTELLTFADAVPLDTSPRPTIQHGNYPGKAIEFVGRKGQGIFLLIPQPG